MRQSTSLRGHGILCTATLSWTEADEDGAVGWYIQKRGVEHVLAFGEREGAERRLVDVHFMAAYLGASDGFVRPLAAWRAIGLQQRAEERLREALSATLTGEATVARASAALVVGEFLCSAGLYGAAASVGDWAREVLLLQLGLDDARTVAAYHAVGVALLSGARHAAAEPLLMQACDAAGRTLGEDHFLTLAIVGSLGTLRRAQGRHAEAEPLCVRAWEGSLRAYGPDQPDTLLALNNLAGLRNGLGQHEEAERLHTMAFEAKLRTLGGEHPSALVSAHNVANQLKRAGRLAEAVALHAEVLRARTRVLGPDHPDTLDTSVCLASILSHQLARHAEAQPLLRRALDARARVLGSEHPETIRTTFALVTLYALDDRPDEAVPLVDGSLHSVLWRLPADNPDTQVYLALAVATGDLCLAHARIDDAERLFAQAQRVVAHLLGEEHPLVLACLDRRARIHAEGERHEQAAPFRLQALEARIRTLGLAHPDTLTNLAAIAAAPETASWQVARALVDAAADADPAMGTPAREALVAGFVDSACWTQAIPILEAILKDRVADAESADAARVPNLWSLACCLSALERSAEASAYRRACWEIEVTHFGATVLGTLQTAVALTEDLAAAGDREAAREVARCTLAALEAEGTAEGSLDEERAPWVEVLRGWERGP